VAERTWNPAHNQILPVPVIIESRENAENTVIRIEDYPGLSRIWTDGSRDSERNVGTAAVWEQDTRWKGMKIRLGRDNVVLMLNCILYYKLQ
jgi:hypothetical protein